MYSSAVTIGSRQWQVSVATTAEELQRGLGGLASLTPSTGMLFDLGSDQQVSVTTEPMLFPIDICFISGSLILTQINRNVQPGNLISGHGRFWLEVNSGELAGVDVGDTASINPLLPAGLPEAVSSAVSIIMNFAPLLILAMFASSLLKRRKKLEKPKQEELPFAYQKKSSWECE